MAAWRKVTMSALQNRLMVPAPAVFVNTGLVSVLIMFTPVRVLMGARTFPAYLCLSPNAQKLCSLLRSPVLICGSCIEKGIASSPN